MIVDDYDMWQQNKTAPVNECHFALINEFLNHSHRRTHAHNISNRSFTSGY